MANKFHYFTKIVLLSVTLLLSAACTGTGGTQYPPTIPPRQVTAEPTVDTSIPTPTVDPSAVSPTTAAEAAASGGTFTTSDGKLSFVYPQGWFVQEDPLQGQIIVANNRAALNSIPGAGQYQVNLVVSPIGELAIDGQNAAQASISALDALIQLADQYQTTGTQVSQPFEESMGGRPAYFVRINNAAFESLLGMVEINGTHIALAAVSARGELSLLEPIARTIGASVSYTP